MKPDSESIGQSGQKLSRRKLLTDAAAVGASFMIVPRHVLGGAGFVAPSDKVTLASIGLGRQGQAVTMELLAHPDVQVIAVCDCNRFSKNYLEYGKNDFSCASSTVSTASPRSRKRARASSSARDMSIGAKI